MPFGDLGSFVVDKTFSANSEPLISNYGSSPGKSMLGLSSSSGAVAAVVLDYVNCCLRSSFRSYLIVISLHRPIRPWGRRIFTPVIVTRTIMIWRRRWRWR